MNLHNCIFQFTFSQKFERELLYFNHIVIYTKNEVKRGRTVLYELILLSKKGLLAEYLIFISSESFIFFWFLIIFACL